MLADRHHGLRDSVRGLLESQFETVIMVADEASLLEGASHLNPAVVVVDLSFSGSDLPRLLDRITDRAPATKVLLLTVHDERTVIEVALRAGASALVLKRDLVTDLLPAIDAVLAGRTYVSPAVSR
jgi:DNA-binding NarL/FixJ family response regulator